MDTTTFNIQIRQCNFYDKAEGFQIVIREQEQNRTFWLWADTTVAACKSSLSGIFATSVVNALEWTGDVSGGTSITQGDDLVWADSPITFNWPDDGTVQPLGLAETMQTGGWNAGAVGYPSTIDSQD